MWRQPQYEMDHVMMTCCDTKMAAANRQLASVEEKKFKELAFTQPIYKHFI